MTGWIQFWACADLALLGVLMSLAIVRRVSVSLKNDHTNSGDTQ